MKKLCGLVALLLLTTPLWGQSSRAIISPQPMWIGARAATLGGSNPTLFGDISSVMINPAAMGSKDVMPFSASSQRVLGEFDYLLINTGWDFEAPISFQGRLKQNIALGLSYGSLQTNNIDRTYLQDFSRIRSLSTYGAGFDMLYFTGATDLFDISGFSILSIGAGLKMLRQTINTNSRTAFGIDVGSIGTYHFSDSPLEKVHIAAAFHNLLSTTAVWDLTDAVTGEHVNDEGFLQPQFFLGARADLWDDSLSIFANNTVDSIAFGAEYWPHRGIALRGSTVSSFSKFSLGTGLLFENISDAVTAGSFGLRLDISYTQNTYPFDLDPNINFSVSILGESKPKTPQIFTPLEELTTQQKVVQLAGVGPKNTTIQIFNNRSLSRTIHSDRYGNWRFTNFPLSEGKNMIYVSAYSIEQQNVSNSDPVMVNSDSIPPKLDVKIYPEGHFLVASVEGSEDLSVVTGNLGNVILSFNKTTLSNWIARTPLPAELRSNSQLPTTFSKINLSARDKAGNASPDEPHNFFAAITFPQDKTVHYQENLRFLGSLAKETRGAQINGQAVAVDAKNQFASEIKLKPGKNLVKVVIKPYLGDDLTYTARILRLITFPDLNRQIKERREVEFMATLGVLGPEIDGNFHPNELVTRRYVARTIVKLKKIPLDNNEASFFSDVPPTDPDAAYIQASLQNGIMFAFPDGTFKPDQPMTLGEILTLFNNAGIVDDTQAPGDNQTITRKEFASYLAFSPKYEVQIEKLIDWEKGYK